MITYLQLHVKFSFFCFFVVREAFVNGCLCDSVPLRISVIAVGDDYSFLLFARRSLTAVCAIAFLCVYPSSPLAMTTVLGLFSPS